jgi:hypothetical protein
MMSDTEYDDAAPTAVLNVSTTDIRPYDWREGYWPNNYLESYTGDNGVIDVFFTKLTFNLDLCKLLGEDYKRDAIYRISPAQIITIPMTGAGWHTAGALNNGNVFNNRALNCIASGLDWVTYDGKTTANMGCIWRQMNSVNAFGINKWRNDEYLIRTQSNWIDDGSLFRATRQHVKFTIQFNSVVNGGDGIIIDPVTTFTQVNDYMQHVHARFIIYKV